MSTLTLRSVCVGVVANNFPVYKDQLDLIPANVLCDILHSLTEIGKDTYADIKLQRVKRELSDLNRFIKLLRADQKHSSLHWIFQTLNNHEVTKNMRAQVSSDDFISSKLSSAFAAICTTPKQVETAKERDILFRDGVLLGDFLYIAGWFGDSAKVLSHCVQISLADNHVDNLIKSLDCLQKLLTSQSDYCLVKDTAKTYSTATVIVNKLKSARPDLNMAKIYYAFANYHFNENRYKEAWNWSTEALKEICKNQTDARVVINILRQASKCCAIKREVQKAKLLIIEAVYRAKEIFGGKSLVYANALLDYGYFLISSDNVQQAVTIYSELAEIRKGAFGKYNYLTAVALEELAYALYIQEYSTGNFDLARQNSEDSISILKALLPEDHVQLASAKRVLALILEEVAIDFSGTPTENELLKEAESLHIFCLQLSTNVFGEMNVTTAKHYGNLGRLYQTMKKFDDAESLHLKAISIKEKLLGKYDYEVALSIGHLASLYNYDMHFYSKAEALHLRSIEIGLKLFGNAYSGLEYDYRGLLQVYSVENQLEKLEEYNRKLSEWTRLQRLKSKALEDYNRSRRVDKSVPDLVYEFMAMEWSQSNDVY